MKWFIVMMLTLVSTSVALSQQELIRNYATQKVNDRLTRANQSLSDQQSSVERFVEEHRKTLQFNKVTIPIVFHIIYIPGQQYPSEEQVYAQIDALNRDSSKRDYRIQHSADTLEGFAKKAEDMEIEFCLAKEGPDGKEEPAIRFIPSTSSKFKDDDALKTQRFGSPAWDTERYLNIWVASMVDEVSGYAQMPGGPGETDGIVIDNRYFGVQRDARTPYNEGKTLTHLVGNYLGLHELWGEYTCSDDYVDDTPIHNAPNYGCPSYKHVSTCGDNPVEMTMNFMDNTNDACQYMFTLGQKIRMQTMLSKGGPRYGLVESDVKCNPTIKNISDASLLETPPDNSTNVAPFTVHIYPNPAFNEFNLQITTKIDAPKKAMITVVNAIGMIQSDQIYDLNNGIQTFIMDCRNWSSGVYYITIRTDGHSSTQHIVVGR